MHVNSPSVLPTGSSFTITLRKHIVASSRCFVSHKGVSAVLFALILFSSVAGGQWTTPVPINPAATYQVYPLIAVGPQRQLAVVCQEAGDRLAIYVSTNHGDSFTRTVLPLPPVPEFRIYSEKGLIYDVDGNLYLLWRWTETYTGLPLADYLTLSKSINGGLTFTTFWQTRQGFMYHETYPLLIESNRTIHIGWDSSGSWGFFAVPIYTKFLNGNLSNRIDKELPRPDGTFTADYFSLLVSGDTVHYASDHAYSYKLYYSRSTNGGTTFAPMVQIDSNDLTVPYLAKVGLEKLLIAYGSPEPTPYAHDILTARYIGDSTISFSGPFNIGSKWMLSQGSRTIVSDSLYTYVAYGGLDTQSVAAYYKFSDLQSPPIDSAFFPLLKRTALAIDVLGGKYLVAEHQSEFRVYFTKRDVVSGFGWGQTLSREFELKQNYPNPFNPVTTISYTIGPDPSGLHSSMHIALKVYDLLGREVMTLVDGIVNAGTHNVSVDGSGLPSGVYFYTLTAGSHRATKKMVLIK